MSQFMGIGHSEAIRPPIFLKLRSSKGFIMFAVIVAIFTDVLLYGLIVPVAPTALRDRVGLSEENEQKWMSILLGLYGATFLAASPLSGYLADRIESRRGPLLVGLVALGASTALLCVGKNLGLWISGRLLQGASAAVVWTVGVALLIDTVQDDGLAQAMGYMDMASTIGVFAGPLLGGVIYESRGYFAVFGLGFALIGIDIFLRLTLIEIKDAAKWLPENKRAPAIPPAVEKSNDAENAPTTLGVSDNAPQEIGEQQNSSLEEQSNTKKWPLLSLILSYRMIVAIWVYFTVSIILTSFDSTLPLYVQETFKWKQTAQGLIFIPLCFAHLFDPLIGSMVDGYDPIRRYLAAGSLVASVPLLVALRFVTENTMRDKILLCALLTVIGLCLALMSPPIMVEVFYVIKTKEQEQPGAFGKGGAIAFSYGMMNAAYAAGSIVGPFFAGYIRANASWGTMAWAMSLLMGVCALPTLLCVGGFLTR